jgi:heme oxygenase
MSLKDLTKERHKAAETTGFMKAVFDRTLPMSVWIDYTYQKHAWYKAIEMRAQSLGLLDNLPGIERADLILADYKEMDKDDSSRPQLNPVAADYCDYIEALTEPKDVLAHLYTWHMGDMFGGQMIKTIIDAPHTHLEFENAKDLMFVLRGMLDDSMADEANRAFDWAINILETYDSSLG